MVLDYTVKPPVTQFYSCRGVHSSDAPTSSDELSSYVPSCPPVEPYSLIDSSLEQLVTRSHHLHRSSDCYSPLAFTATALSEPASYRDAILHPKW
jgi:hypothetical protein